MNPFKDGRYADPPKQFYAKKDCHLMAQGRNKAELSEKILAILDDLAKSEAQPKVACVFISHKREDTAPCEKIANYIMDAGINVYFDKYDKTDRPLRYRTPS